MLQVIWNKDAERVSVVQEWMKRAKQIRKRQRTFFLSSKEVQNLFWHFQGLIFFWMLSLLRALFFALFLRFLW